ncbi:replication termination factor 2 [Ischnura elegans]|uniref:replication termination factor 2 n=1 Tax=Ischnura elegans TaxID=197161 RepID=UPI001ED8699E|nr:replication termination factor 2 [Ischnura elegans]XP_046394873.1 replication termination factor 2 [Ischnura elegans]
MGCDGGTIPRRDELVRTKKKPEKKDKAAELAFRWNCCTISQNTLQKPVVACGMGRLYSKIAVIENLLEKKEFPEVSQHVKTLKDVRELNLTPNPAYKEGSVEKGDASGDPGISPYICPVIGLEMNGRFGFIFLWSCGCVFSERALKEVKTNVCHKCQKPFTEDDVVTLNPSDEELDRAMVKMEARKAREKAAKAKKRKNTTAEVCNSTEAGPSGTSVEIKKEPVEEDDGQVNGKLPKLVNGTIKKEPTGNPSTSGAQLNGKPQSKLGSAKGYSGGASSSNSSGGQSKLVDPLMKKAANGYSVSKDPNASEVYKSLFTTHEKARQQTKAHWVTYNPFYN